MKRVFSNKIIFVFLLGFGLRFYACMNTPIVNPDGVQLIHQARAIYYGEWESITYCSLSYVSNYPFFIAGAYTIFHDWIIAARSISFLFGFSALIPLYFLLKRFFDDNISALCTLIFALIPVFVSRSGDVVRGPVYWFFLMLGLYFFVAQINNKSRIYLLFSNLSFLMATWARIEAILFVIVSCLYILLIEKERKLESLAIFVSPVFILILFSIFWALISDVSVNNIYRMRQILPKLSGTIDQYQGVRTSLRELATDHRDSILSNFLPKARNLLWLIALGTVVRYAVAAFFYPFFFIFIIGLGGIWERIKNDRRVLYLSLLSISGLVLLYIHVMHTWVMMYRFLAIAIIPSCIFAGFGLEKILRFLQARFGLKESAALIVVCLLILVSGLPKNLKPRETDKAIFRQIGEIIAKREGNHHVITVAAAPSTVHEWVSFYANLKYPGVFCARDSGTIGEDYSQFVKHLMENGIRYFLWEENRWPVEKIDFIHTQYRQDFKELGRWRHPDTERIILFEVIGSK